MDDENKSENIQEIKEIKDKNADKSDDEGDDGDIFEESIGYREIRKYKKNNNKILSTNNTNKIETTMINNATMDSTKKDENNKYENLDKLSDISILQLDNKIEGLDTERLIDLNIIDAFQI